jgi:hypothetical protein
MYLNKKNYAGINNIDFYNFFYLDILPYILVILSLDILSVGYFDLDILLHDILSQSVTPPPP